jgi:hypothetical protein
MADCPERFYRYRSLAGDDAAFVERTVHYGEIYFPKPSSFNDPFDCRPSFSFEATKAEMTKYYRGLVKKYMSGLNREHRREEARNKLGDWERSPRNPKTLRRVTELHTEQITENIGVLCLSEVCEDILMWSHYADSHRGVCLEFDGCFEFFANAQKVDYPPTRPRINPFRQNPTEMMEAALLTKAEHWKYEREWRIVQYKSGPGIKHFPPESLTGIILGAQISDIDAKRVIGWAESRVHPIRVLRASADETSFSLKFEEVLIVPLRT